MKTSQFNIGDKVNVVDDMVCYPIFESMFKKFGFKIIGPHNCKINDTGTIFNIGNHPTNDDIILIAVKNNEKQFLIGESGLIKN